MTSDSTHSLFHSSGVAYCKTPWEKMVGSPTVRSCPSCTCRAYNLQGLSSDAAMQLVVEAEGGAPAQLRLYRRSDGTFATSNPICGDSWSASWQTWTAALSTVIRVMGKSPAITASLIILMLFESALPGVGPGWKQLSQGLNCVIGVCQLALACRLVKAQWAAISHTEWTPASADTERLWNAWWNSSFYSMGVGLGLLLLIVPGVIAAAQSCLCLTVIVLESKGPLQAFSRSGELTRGCIAEVCRYLAMPTLAWSLLLAIQIALGVYATLAHASVILVLFALRLAEILGILAFAPMHVNLYKRLKDRKEALSAVTA